MTLTKIGLRLCIGGHDLARIVYLLLFFLTMGCSTLEFLASDDLTSEIMKLSSLSSQTHTSTAPSTGAESQIFNGTDVKAKDPLAQRAVLLLMNKKGKITSCTATPITETLLLTAAHCVFGVDSAKITAVFTHDATVHIQDGGGTRIAAQRQLIHENYDGTPQSKADLALVKLQNKIPKGYEPVGLYNGKDLLSEDTLTMLGYGVSDEQKTDSLVLRTTQKSYASDVYIKDGLIGFNQRNSTGGFCRGDSGAPIYVKTHNTLKVIGINSFVASTEPNRECRMASFAMYTPYFRSWILSNAVKL